MLDVIALIAGILYGYSNPGSEDRVHLLKKGVAIGLVLGFVITVFASFIGLAMVGPVIGATAGIVGGISVIIGVVYLTVIFVIGTLIGDFIENIRICRRMLLHGRWKINLPWREKEYLGVRAGSRWPFKSLPEADGRIHYIPFPFFLAYAASLLKKNGKEAKLLDAIAEGIEEKLCIEEVKEYNPLLIAAETSTPSFSNDIRILENIKNILPSVQIALCGPHASTFPEDILSHYEFVDYIIVGEYELSLLELVNCLGKAGDLSFVSGLVYREGKTIKINIFKPAVSDLNIFPWPEREDVPIYNYNDGFCNLPQPNVQVWASRGCPYQCTFCLWPQVIYREHKYRRRAVTDVVNEMVYLIDKYKFKAIYFDDDVFNVDRDYVVSVCSEIKKRNIKIPWACMARADLMDEELLKIMEDAGLYAIKYGIESADEEVLRRCEKNMDLDRTKRLIYFTKRVGIKVHLTFCVGLLAETNESINKTAKFIRDVNPDSLQISCAVPFPGTELYNDLENRLILESYNWSDFDGNCGGTVCIDGLSRETLKKRRHALESVRFNK